MYLQGQELRRGEAGYAMAALLVMIAVMAVVMSAAMPVWRHAAQREKESELVFRGQQYVRAIRLYNNRLRSFPPSVDALVQGRYLRKKFKDPITGDDFQVLSAGAPAPGLAQPGQTQPGSPGRVAQPQAQPQPGGAPGIGGIIGVASKSKDESIRIYQLRNHYNEWPFIFVQQTPIGPGGRPGPPGGRGGGAGGTFGPGGRGVPPGGRGVPPGGRGDGRSTTPGFPGRPGDSGQPGTIIRRGGGGL
jgi:type II secretory pathway pseudopilin PulG